MEYQQIVKNMGSDDEATRLAAIDKFETIMQTGGEAMCMLLFLQDLDTLPSGMACNSVMFALFDHAWRDRRAEWALLTAKVIWKLQLAAYTADEDQGHSVLTRVMRDACRTGKNYVSEDLRNETPAGQESVFSECYRCATA